MHAEFFAPARKSMGCGENNFDISPDTAGMGSNREILAVNGKLLCAHVNVHF
jgi:hypothetical protein